MGFVGEGLGSRNGRSDDQPLAMTNSRPSDWPALPAMLEQNASHFGARAALLSDGDEPLSHQQLRNQVAVTVTAFNSLGVGRSDRVAIVLPQGPDLAVIFLAVAAGATAAPLNPAYVEKEFLFYLEDLQARALIVPRDSDSPARAVADSLGVPVIELIPGENGVGRFHLSGVSRPLAASAGFAEADDVALVLHTSGTTSRPKMVPLTHATLLAAARHIGALPPPVMTGLEETFGVPVIESYGMTEAAHQMASNPLPPRARKPGSVGLATGLEVAILDEAGETLASGRTGEVAIRGPNVTCGYVNNSEANATAFCRGWFRTGDQGHLDGEGYLFITGRLKELINRGGEKIAPREIDEVLLAYPGVQQAVAFDVPHPSLGEDIAAAVVLKDGAPDCEAAFREFALDRLPMFKVPSRIILVNDVPKGWTGKIQRVGLAERLAAALTVPYEGPASDTERLVAT